MEPTNVLGFKITCSQTITFTGRFQFSYNIFNVRAGLNTTSRNMIVNNTKGASKLVGLVQLIFENIKT